MPSEPELAADEEVVFHTRLHPIVFGGTVTFAAFVIGVTALIVVRNDLPSSTVLLLWLAAAGIIVASFAPPLLRWRASTFTLTNRRVLARTGLFRAHLLEVPWGRLEALEVEQSLAGRALGYGTLRVAEKRGPVEVFQRVGGVVELRAAAARHAPGSARARAR